MLTRRHFLRQGAAVAGALAMPRLARAAGRTDRPNVVFISVDDMNTDPFGNAPDTPQAPNLLSLAARGTYFDRNYCQYPLCGPSRASLMTGQRPDVTRVLSNGFNFRRELPHVVTLPQLFMQHGYFSARVGKIYHYDNPLGIGTSGMDDPASWNQVINPAGRDRKVLLDKVTQYTPGQGIGASLSYYRDETGTDEEYTDGLVVKEAIGLMEKHRDEPFFLGVGFYKPHTPYIVPKKWFDLYPLDKVVAPVVPAHYRDQVPEGALESTTPWPDFGVTPEQSHECKRAYYAAISFVDAQIGKVVAAVDRLGLSDNTIIVFWADHGYHVGDHGLWFKQSCFEHAARVPLIIAAPGAAGAGKRCGRITEHVNLYPTLADLAGLTPAAPLGGVSMRTLLDRPDAEWNRPAFTQTDREGSYGWSVRTPRWRYTQWNELHGGEELYDHANDPQEMTNLIKRPEHAEDVAQLRALVKQNWPRRVLGGGSQQQKKKKKKQEA